MATVLLACLAPMTAMAAPPTPEQIEPVIQDGLEWLVGEQRAGGFWGSVDGSGNPYLYYGEYVARTGFALVKLEDRAFETGYDPFDPDYEYNSNVEDGLDYIFSQARTHGAGTGLYFLDQAAIDLSYNIHETYNTAVAMMAIAASRSPDEVISSTNTLVNLKTYKQVMDELVQYFVWSQNTNGGWGYYPNYPGGRSDNSITGYAVLGLRYAEASLYGFECTIPTALKTSLSSWIDYIQNDLNGGSGYENPENWVNLLKTGNLLFEMSFVGDTSAATRAQNAIDYIQQHWNEANQDPGWKGNWDPGPPPTGKPHYQAMYCLMKGFQSMDIEEITVGGSDIDWFIDAEQFAEVIVSTQQGNGAWDGGTWGDEHTNTVWALLTLEKLSPPPPVDVVVEVPECACDITGYDVNVTYTVERIPSTGTVEVYKDDVLYDTIILTDFSGTESKVYNIASDTPGMHTWKAVIDVTTGAGAQAHAEEEDTVGVCRTPVVDGIPDQIVPFYSFDLDDYLILPLPALPISWSCTAPAEWTVEIDAENVATVTAPVDASEPVTITFTASITCPCGVICSDSDDAIFVPNRPPDCSEAYAEPACLWPPNHKFVDISVMGVTDPDGDPVTITITAITSDEATATDEGSGGAKHAPDADGVGTDTAAVRAERSGNGDGRVYMIHFVASDGRGGECSGSVIVKVPHDQSAKDCPAIDSGQNYDATQIN